MGFFDTVVLVALSLIFDKDKKISNRVNEMESDAETECERMTTESICDKVKRSYHNFERIPATSGYTKVLRRRFEEMSDYELKDLGQRLYRDKNPAYNLLKQELQNRGLIV